jgi:flagellin
MLSDTSFTYQATVTARWLATAEARMGLAATRLASGQRVNRVGDDPTGFTVAALHALRARALRSGVDGAQDALAVTRTAEGALNTVTDLVRRLRTLAVDAANGGDGASAQAEVAGILASIDDIARTTRHGSLALLDGSYGRTPGTLTGLDADNQIDVGPGDSITVAVAGGSGPLDVALTAGSYTVAGFATMVEGATRGVLAAAPGSFEQAAADTLTFVAAGAGPAATLTVTNSGSAAVSIGDGNGSPLADLDATIAGSVDAASGNGGRFLVGADSDDTYTLQLDAVDSSSLGLGGVDLAHDAAGSLGDIDAALADLWSRTSTLGVDQVRLEQAATSGVGAATAADSVVARITDVDTATEIVAYLRAQVQANTAATEIVAYLRAQVQANTAAAEIVAYLRAQVQANTAAAVFAQTLRSRPNLVDLLI